MTNEHKHNSFNFNEIKCFICYDKGYEQGEKDERERIIDFIGNNLYLFPNLAYQSILLKELMKDEM